MQHSPNPPVLYSFPTKGDIITPLAEFVVKAQKEAVARKGKFTVAFSGGSLPQMLRGLIGDKQVKWELWYCTTSSSISENPYN
jgi:6-phosphogluconolactonase